jgi:hypothetical protein
LFEAKHLLLFAGMLEIGPHILHKNGKIDHIFSKNQSKTSAKTNISPKEKQKQSDRSLLPSRAEIHTEAFGKRSDLESQRYS